MAEDKYIEFDAKDHTGKDVTIFSTSGEARPEQDFHKVMSTYNQSAGRRLPASFTVLPKGSFTQQARSLYETVNEPIQVGAQRIGSAIGGLATTSPALMLGQKLGLVPEGTTDALYQKGSDVGRNVAELATSPFKTPEAAMGTLGTIAGLAATKKMSTIPQMVGAGVGTFGLLQAAKPVFGGQKDVGMDIAESMLAMAGAGIFGAAQTMFGKSLSAQSQAKFAKDIGGLMDNELSHIAKDPGAVQAFFSTPDGVDRLIQTGVKHFREDLDTITNGIIKSVNSRAPNTLSRSAASQMRDLSEQLFDAGNDYLQVIGDKGNAQAARGVLRDIHGKMQEVLRAEFAQAGQKKGLANVIGDLDKSIFAHRQYLERFRGSEELVGALNRAKDKMGHVTPKRFREEIASYYQENPGSLLEAAGKLTQRGGPPLTVAGDSSVMRGSIPIPTPKMLGNWSLPVGPLGQSYTGNVVSPTQQALSALGTALATRAGTQQVKPRQE